jgi:hypothetical protein
VERNQQEENETYVRRQFEILQQVPVEADEMSASIKGGLLVGNRSKDYASMAPITDITHTTTARDEVKQPINEGMIVDGLPKPRYKINAHQTIHHDTATFDFIGMTQALFSSRRSTRLVMALFYTNIFLVLGDYILVMSHAGKGTPWRGLKW